MEEVEEEESPKEQEDIVTAFQTIFFDDEEESEGSDQCDSQHLLIKNTDSFRCLAQVILSNSSLLRQKLFLFPPLQDPGIDEAFNFVEPEPVYDDIGVERYLQWCKDLEIVPISRVVKSLPEDTLDLKYYGITQKQMKALSETLKKNAHVENVVLQDNWLTEEQTMMLSSVMEYNTVLRVLNLKECRIGEKGAEYLNDALSAAQLLTELDLSYNSLGNKGILQLQSGLSDAISLAKLNLSHNELTEECAATLEQIIIENKRLEDLDLSWNGFYTGPGNKKLCNGLLVSDRIKKFSLAYNGIGLRPAAVPLRKYINRSQTLQEIDLSGNRMKENTFKVIRTSVNKNHSLIVVNVGNNPLTPEDAYSIANVFGAPAKAADPLKHLDLENIFFKKEILPVLDKIKAAGRTVRYAGIIGNFKIIGPNIIELLFKRCRYLLMKPKKKKAKKDFGHFILRLPDQLLTKEDFQAELKRQKIKKLDQDLINEICNRFVAKKKVDCPELTKAYMELYPDTCLPPPKPKKEKKRKKGKKGKKGKKQQEQVVAVIDLETPATTEQQGIEQQQGAAQIQQQPAPQQQEQQTGGQQETTEPQQNAEPSPDQQQTT